MNRGTSFPRVLLLVLICMTVRVQAAQPELVDFSLEDHDRTLYTRATWSGRPLVLFLADKKGSAHDKGYVWSAPIIAFLRTGTEDRLVFASVADLRGTPRLARGVVRGMFESKMGDPVGLTLLDWQGTLFRAYDLEAGAFHLLVFDSGHRLVYRTALSGFDAARLASIEHSLDELWPDSSR